jgi:hypothetical protein
MSLYVSICSTSLRFLKLEHFCLFSICSCLKLGNNSFFVSLKCVNICCKKCFALHSWHHFKLISHSVDFETNSSKFVEIAHATKLTEIACVNEA